MSRTALLGAFILVSAGLSGCASPARIVKQDPTMVVVAVPDHSNTWPYYYRDEATKAAGEFIQDPVLVSSIRTKVGENTTTVQDINRRDLGTEKNKIGELTTATNSTSVSDSYEYHLEFQSRTPVRNPSPIPGSPAMGAGAMPVPTNGPILPAGGTMPNREMPMGVDTMKLPPPTPSSPSLNLPNTTPPGR